MTVAENVKLRIGANGPDETRSGAPLEGVLTRLVTPTMGRSGALQEGHSLR